MFLGCVIRRRSMTIWLPPSGLAKNIILNTIGEDGFNQIRDTFLVMNRRTGVLHHDDMSMISLVSNPAQESIWTIAAFDLINR